MLIPDTIGALTPEFLTGALAAASGGAEVRAVRADDIGAGVGVFGLIARLHLTWVGASAEAPATVIAKLPTTAEANRNVGMLLGLYEREHRFYADAATRVPVRVPRCYFNSGAADEGSYLLLLEDLAAMEAGDQLSGLSARRAKAVIQRFAELHAHWWDSPQLHELDWLPVQNDPVFLEVVPSIVSAGVAALAPHVANLPPGSLELAQAVDESFVALTHACAAGPHTFVHGDARLDNLFFAPGTDDCTIIDWQLSLRCRGVADVVWLLATSMDPDVQNAHIDQLLDTYRSELANHGVEVSARDLRQASAVPNRRSAGPSDRARSRQSRRLPCHAHCRHFPAG